MDDNAATVEAPLGTVDDDDTEPAPRSASQVALDRAPVWVFAAFIAVAGPLILFHYGAYHWFFRDEWSLLADRGSGKVPDLLKPNGGVHWTTVPRLLFLVLWKLFGMTTYRPYQACVVALHLTVAVLLRVVMRRSGVSPWLATAAASAIVLFGPGSQNIVWAFQVGFTGSVAYGLAQLLLSDHEGGIDRRDALGLGFGVLAIMSSGVGITTTLAVGIAVLARRGWKPALLHTAPLAVMQAIWMLVANPTTTGVFGRPKPGVLATWVRNSAIDTFSKLGHAQPLAWAFLIVLVAGLVLLFLPSAGRDWRALRMQLAAPVALAIGALEFATSTGVGRWYTGDAGAGASRYMYITVALTLPLLAVAAQSLATRWRPLLPVMVAMFLLTIPLNLGGFDPEVFGPKYMENRRYVLTTAVRMPFANDVPRNVQPIPDPYSSEAVTIGFLLNAERNGQLNPSTIPLKPRVVNEFKVRLGVAQRRSPGYPSACETYDRPITRRPARGSAIGIASTVAVSTQTDGRPTSFPVSFDPVSGTKLEFELPDLDLRFAPARGASTFVLCQNP